MPETESLVIPEKKEHFRSLFVTVQFRGATEI